MFLLSQYLFKQTKHKASGRKFMSLEPSLLNLKSKTIKQKGSFPR